MTPITFVNTLKNPAGRPFGVTTCGNEDNCTEDTASKNPKETPFTVIALGSIEPLAASSHSSEISLALPGADRECVSAKLSSPGGAGDEVHPIDVVRTSTSSTAGRFRRTRGTPAGVRLKEIAAT